MTTAPTDDPHPDDHAPTGLSTPYPMWIGFESPDEFEPSAPLTATATKPAPLPPQPAPSAAPARTPTKAKPSPTKPSPG